MNLTAICTWSDGWWAIEIAEMPHVYSQARRLDQVKDMVCEAAALHSGKPVGSFTVDVVPRLESSDEALITQATERKQAALSAARAAAEANREAAHRLRDRGLSMRDVGALLGVSYQRAHKLVNDHGT